MTGAGTSPGEVLRKEFMVPLGLGVTALAKALQVSEVLLQHILSGRQAVSVETALRLARYFGTTPQFWLSMQTNHDLSAAEHTVSKRIHLEVQPRRS